MRLGVVVCAWLCVYVTHQHLCCFEWNEWPKCRMACCLFYIIFIGLLIVDRKVNLSTFSHTTKQKKERINPNWVYNFGIAHVFFCCWIVICLFFFLVRICLAFNSMNEERNSTKTYIVKCWFLFHLLFHLIVHQRVDDVVFSFFRMKQGAHKFSVDYKIDLGRNR